MCGTVTGMICDGGSTGCALKASAGVYSAYLSAMLAMEGVEIPHNFGVIGSSAEQTEKNLGRISDKTFRFSDAMVFPQTPNFFPSKQVMAHRKKLSPMARVFPDRTAPSQTMASFPANSFPGTHQVSAVFCFGENF